MSIENFCASLERQLSELRAQHGKLSGSEKGAVTRKISALQDAIKKATRKGVQE